MTLKITNNWRYAPAPTYTYAYYNGQTVLTGTALRGEGGYSSIDSVYTGRFVPGIFRANPVVIKKSFGHCTPDRLVYRLTTDARSTRTYEGMLCRSKVSINPPDVEYWDTIIANYSRNKAQAKLLKGRADLGVFVGELGETLRMLRNPLKELVDLFAKWRNPKFKNSFALADSMNNFWLKYKFGILPLIKDIQDIRTLFENEVVKSNNGLFAVHARKDHISSSTTSYGEIGFYDILFQAFLKEDIDLVSYSSVYSRMVAEGLLNSKSRDFGLSGAQMPRVLWQLVPYSFVVDWAVDFSSWLLAIAPKLHADFMGACTSQKLVITQVWNISNARIPDNPQIWPLVSSSYGNYTRKTELLVRKIDPNLPAMPGVNLSLLQAKNLDKALTLVALTWQRLPNTWRRK